MYRNLPAILLISCTLFSCSGGPEPTDQRTTMPTAEEARAIAKEAYIYSFPMLMGYRYGFATFLVPELPSYRGPLNAMHGEADPSLAIDGKTMCNALDDQGRQTHVMSVVGHHTKTCYTQKKSVPCR